VFSSLSFADMPIISSPRSAQYSSIHLGTRADLGFRSDPASAYKVGVSSARYQVMKANAAHLDSIKVTIARSDPKVLAYGSDAGHFELIVFKVY